MLSPTLRWSRCPGPPTDTRHEPKAVPRRALELAQAEGRPGLWLVTTRRETGARHYSIIAICACGDVATHGGVEEGNEHRAIYWAREHADRYGLQIRTELAPELHASVYSGDPGRL